MLSYNKSKNLCVRFVMPDARSVCSDENFKFSNYTTYRLGGGARRAYFPRNFAEARAAFDIAKQDGVTHFVLANGSNVLASDSDYGGDVICTRRLSAIVRVDEEHIFCLSGTGVGTILKYCVAHGLGGLEYLAGIPASIGGIVYMNGGAAGRYICSNVKSVRIYNGTDIVLSSDDCQFAYKHSTMQDMDCIILGVLLAVVREDRRETEQKISRVLQLRKNLPAGKSCGCVFKNPEGISAGRLIEQCGLSGIGSGRVFVSPDHCNFIINNGGSAIEVKELIEIVKHTVFLKTSIMLEEEVVCVGDF